MAFGKSIRNLWRLEPDCIFLNHGSFGACPIAVLEKQQQWRSQLERQPVRFMGQELPVLLRAAAADLAEFVGATGQDLVFVENATAGVNAVVRSLQFSPGDQIVVTNHTYGAVRKTLEFIGDRVGIRPIEAVVPFPIERPEQVIEAIAGVISSSTKLLVVDHITSATALILPVIELVKLAREHKIPTLIDGAHAPGMIDLDLQAIGADWYVGNCHKWLCAPKGCGFLWTNPNSPFPQLTDQIHPTVISHGYGSGYVAEFDWVGTRDPSAWLAVSEAIKFQRSLDQMTSQAKSIKQRNHNLVIWAVDYLNQAWQQSPNAPTEMLGSMATIALPTMPISAVELNDRLWQEYQIEVPVMPFADRLWLRISAQAYNQESEYKLLAQAIQTIAASFGAA
ncbi:Isopenicillin-N epimerase [Thalassoporum mexicanum PCC 7367]|uniref:aminotransferase class V-fold PLP-dependent enzyme n=1 Tax=Thalassoporum mexicanum TaxID=3457544 RepID=UPI00029FC2F5|nr:aminotransferase class V-fold PLP-dependent enzyme [Pseudanabaena sp. PCC 7367]AFY68865.1 Isopenicillin-N epimerase [Pseudanabaena sp. PCC 7367]